MSWLRASLSPGSQCDSTPADLWTVAPFRSAVRVSLLIGLIGRAANELEVAAGENAPGYFGFWFDFEKTAVGSLFHILGARGLKIHLLEDAGREAPSMSGTVPGNRDSSHQRIVGTLVSRSDLN